jgi:hypothetical protein
VPRRIEYHQHSANDREQIVSATNWFAILQKRQRHKMHEHPYAILVRAHEMQDFFSYQIIVIHTELLLLCQMFMKSRACCSICKIGRRNNLIHKQIILEDILMHVLNGTNVTVIHWKYCETIRRIPPGCGSCIAQPFS